MEENIDKRLKNTNKQKVKIYRDYLQKMLDKFVATKGYDLQYKVLDIEKTKLVVVCEGFESSVDNTKSEIYKKEDFENEEDLRKYIYKKAENTAKSVLIEHNNYMQINNIQIKKLTTLEEFEENSILKSNLNYLNLSIFTLLYFNYLVDIVDYSDMFILSDRLVIQFKIINPEFKQYKIKPFVLPVNITKYLQTKQLHSTNKNFNILADAVLKHINNELGLSKSDIVVRLISADLNNGGLSFSDIFTSN